MGIDVNVRVGGGAGQGVHTVSNLIARMAVAAGYHIHVTQDYMSRIRGGRNSQTVRIGSDPVRAGADILLAIHPDHLPHILPGVAKGGFAIADIPSADPVFAKEFKGDFFEKNRAAFRLGADWAKEHLPEEITQR
ncbi:MAG TPA: 2-oxoacid:acceptor oxidoreductase family protein, partial [Deferrimonas sp.]